MRGVLSAEPVWVETLTGLRMRHFEGLLRTVRKRSCNGPGSGRPWALPLSDRVLLVAVYYSQSPAIAFRRRAGRGNSHAARQA